MRIISVEQGTPEWLAARAGLVTASRISDVMAVGKGGAESLTRQKYLVEVAVGMLTGQMPKTYQSKAMQDGVENEPRARAEYEIARQCLVDQVGLVLHPTIEGAAASPDGLVGEDGLVEIKSPELHTHVGYWLSRVVPRDYLLQMQFQMSCTKRKWNDFTSFNDMMPERSKLLIIRVDRDDKLISEIEQKVVEFIKDAKVLAERIGNE